MHDARRIENAVCRGPDPKPLRADDAIHATAEIVLAV
jgi:hypothetical protein